MTEQAGAAELVAEHDVVGVGIGPFNLGLAALLHPLTDVDAVFFEARPAFSWHAGLLLDGTKLQVPFLGDLVTMADPTSPFSFLNYLHCRSRLYRFYFYEKFHVPRQEYDAYCRWVAEQLPSCHFGQRVIGLHPNNDETWTVLVRGPSEDAEGLDKTVEHRAGAVVLGVGSRPVVPRTAAAHLGDTLFHSANYRPRRDRVLAARSATVIGSGQSAAEIFADLLENGPGRNGRLDWFTRSRGFLPMEYSKLGLEHFSPEYINYFHGLGENRRDEVRSGQDLLYKAISSETSAEIFDLLYERTIDGSPDVSYRSSCELRKVDPDPGEDHNWRLTLHHIDEDVSFDHQTDVVVLATGYQPAEPPFDPGLASLIERDSRGRPVVELDYRIRLADRGKSTLFIQNGELHTHGVGAPDLGLGAHRNAVLANTLVGREVYPVRSRNVFQSFGAP